MTDAYISGALGQAIYIDHGCSMILDASKPNNPRISTANDVSLFFSAALEIVPIERGTISFSELSHRLVVETKQFDALDGLLVGMDSDQDMPVRKRFIARSEHLMNGDEAVASFVRRRFLIPTDRKAWDVSEARVLATSIKAMTAELMYEIVQCGLIDRLTSDVQILLQEVLGGGARAAHAEELIVRSGLIGEIAVARRAHDSRRLTNIIFRRDDFPALRGIDPQGKIITRLVARYLEKPSRDAAASEGEKFDELPPENVVRSNHRCS